MHFSCHTTKSLRLLCIIHLLQCIILDEPGTQIKKCNLENTRICLVISLFVKQPGGHSLLIVY